ncbi:GH92 family glycosyl hydrolase [Alkaliflexus imshenetskii]|uniref:GH92 family glycosyl hydrolase n=1 Tax=Alkaliflexus imshenetskii TaxID=286730 RepID=UPI0004B031F5|nr:GH92 family glycosyl hydrolase [Alkaliflexus imshenetskii]
MKKTVWQKSIRKGFKLLLAVNLMLPLVSGCTSPDTETTEDLARYVDPYIGTDYHGHVFIGAHVPFGAVQIGPTNYIYGWDWTSGYHYSDSIMTGFSQLHLSGTGIGDLGDVLMTPYTGDIHFTPGNINEPLKGYASLYTHEQEKAEAGYYAVRLLDYDIDVELTASERVGFHRYTFPQSENARVAINLKLGIGWDRPVNTMLKQINDTTLAGFRYSTGWAEDQRVYFAIVTSRPIEKLEFDTVNKLISDQQAEGNDVVGVLTWATAQGEQIQFKVGISPVSIDGAINNIRQEIPHWNFEAVKKEARDKWNRELAKIKVSHKDPAVLRTFYTAMYHAFTAPVLFNDHDTSYRGTDKEVYTNPGFSNYSVFSLWDTYRAVHPLFTIVQHERVDDMVTSMLKIYQQQGKLPIWHLMGSETNCMVGYSAVPVVADAFFKGFTGFARDLAYEAVLASSMLDEEGIQYLKKYGFIPADLEQESVSKALEYAISDWAISRMAEKMGDEKNQAYYHTRSKAFERYFDPETQFLRPVLKDGSFKSPFDPIESIHEGYAWTDYTEGNAWQYTFMVPHDVYGLIDLMGGDAAFETKFDSLFFVTGDLGQFASPDISGLVGQYAQGNEPSHHAAYLYAFSGNQWKTAEKTRYIMDKWYTDQPDGLPGNEDCGQMSAWYIFSSLGFYPVNPSNSVFVFGSPLFDKATISLPNNKTFTVKALNNSKENIYIQSVTLNNRPITRTYITYREIMNGGTLVFEMGNTPNKSFGKLPEDRPLDALAE